MEKERTTLDLETTIKETLVLGLKNAASILGCIVLWLLTIWIPWINIGTTIAIATLPAELSKGSVISPTSIFAAKYRENFGNVFLLFGLMYFPILFSIIFMVIPAIVLSIMWSLAILFVVDKNKNPIEALQASQKAVLGSKWTIFISQLVVIIIVFVAGGILIYLSSLIWDTLGVIVGIIVYLIAISIMISLNAVIYKKLKNNA